jgi:predicted secreted hydrolase
MTSKLRHSGHAATLVAAAALITTLGGGAAAAADASPTPEVGPVVLPREHGVHPGFQVEWWYGAGVVRDRRGQPYSWFATIWSGGPGPLRA